MSRRFFTPSELNRFKNLTKNISFLVSNKKTIRNWKCMLPGRAPLVTLILGQNTKQGVLHKTLNKDR